MITIYKATNNDSELKPIQNNRSARANVVADLALGIIRAEGKIPRVRLLANLRAQYEIHRYSNGALSNLFPGVSKDLEQQGLIERTEETLEQYLTGGKLTYNQIQNYRSWIVEQRILEGHLVKGRLGYYSPEEETIFGKIGEYVSNGVSSVEAIKLAIGEVLGEQKAAQFYEGLNKGRGPKNVEYRRKKRTEVLQEDPSKVSRTTDYDKIMVVYDDPTYRTLSDAHGVILDRVDDDFWQQHREFIREYPFDLYFALSPAEPKAILREKLDSLMQSTPTARFADYESTIFGSIRKSLEQISARLVVYSDRGFEESEEQIMTLEKQIDDLQEGAKWNTKRQIGGMKRSLELVKARYKDSGILITQVEIGQQRGRISKQAINIAEAKGLELLREQPTIQELLSLHFWEI